MKTLSEEAARKLGYKAVTVPICPNREAHIVASIETTLGRCNSAWVIVDGGRDAGKVYAARHCSQIKEVQP